MDDKTRDLIFELASGSLPREEAERLEASLSAEAADELATHRELLAIIAQEPMPSMSDQERRALEEGVQRALADTTRELNAVEIVQPAPQRRRFNWVPLATAASALAVFGAVAITAGSLMGGDDDGGSAADVTTTTLSSPTTAPASLGGDALESAAGDVFIIEDPDDGDVGEIEFLAEEGATVNELRDVLTTMAARQVGLDPEQQPCADEAAVAAGEALTSAFFGIYDETKVIAFSYDAAPDDDSMGVLVLDTGTCEVLPRSADGRFGDAPSR